MLIFYGWKSILYRFNAAQNSVSLLLACAFSANIVTVGVCAFIVFCLPSFGLYGPAIAADVGMLFYCFSLFTISVTVGRETFEHIWPGFTWNALNHWWDILKLGLPLAGCILIWHASLEIGDILAGIFSGR